VEQEMMGWQWHQLDHMQIICTSLQTDTMPVPHHSVFTDWMPFLPPNQQRQSTKSKSAEGMTSTYAKLKDCFSVLLHYSEIALKTQT